MSINFKLIDSGWGQVFDAAGKLSPEAYHGLNIKLEAAFQKHGKLSEAELEQLDRPELPD